MDLLNLSDSIFCEFVHTASMDSRRAYRPARPHFRSLFSKVADTRSHLSSWPVRLPAEGGLCRRFSGASHDCARVTGNPSLIWCDPVNIFESLVWFLYL